MSFFSFFERLPRSTPQVENGTLSVRTYAQGELGSVPAEQLVELLVDANANKRATIVAPA